MKCTINKSFDVYSANGMMLIPNTGLLIENILCKETQYLLVKGYLVDPANIMYQKYCGVHG